MQQCPRTHLATQPVPSTGPYRVAQLIPGRRLLLVRNERFREWSRAAQPGGYPDRIDIRMDDDPSHRAEAVLRGDADLALEIASANLAPLRTRFASQPARQLFGKATPRPATPTLRPGTPPRPAAKEICQTP
jgi:peptide/nickel transport system substrate-binding protein